MTTDMKDMVVILPGILGSVLQKDGKDLWNVSGQAIWQVIKSLGGRLQDLQLAGDDADVEDLGDGIRATGIIADTHLIPGLWKIDGYTKTSQLITDNFQVIPGDIYQDAEDKAANFYHFPYDWRRDNRANAKNLKRLLDKRLKTWRESSGNSNAKVILLAHSMGGLISRYYLEVLGGWQDCRALFTFGTPYRGSLMAVNFLANGYKKAFIDLTEVMRSFNSVYQLLPIYKVLQIANESHRIGEVSNLPNIDPERAKDALAFHREIETAVGSNQNDPNYHPYATVPFVGVQQPTFQSAELKQGKIIIHRDLPLMMRNRNLDSLADGDGTVPKISAFPIEFSDRDTLEIPGFIAEAHGSLQNQPAILLNLLNKLRISQATEGTLEDIRGRGEAKSRSIKADTKGISVWLEDLYLQNEPIVIKAKVNSENLDDKTLKGHIVCVSERRPDVEVNFAANSDGWLSSEDLRLEPGLYRLKVATELAGEAAPHPVNDLFEVADINI